MVNGTTWIPSPCLDSVPEDHGYMYAERMYEVIPVPYMIWKVVYTTIFSLVAVFMGWDCFVRLSYLHRHSLPRCDYRTVVYCILIVSCVVRVLWNLDPHWKSRPGPFLFGSNVHSWAVANAIMARVPQVGLMISVLLQVDLWRATIKRSRRLENVHKNDAESRALHVKIFLLFLIFFAAAVCDIAAYFFPNARMLKQLYNAVGGLVFLILAVAGFRYTRALSKMIGAMYGGSSSERNTFKEKAAKAMRKVRFVIHFMLGLVFMVMVSLAIRFSTRVRFAQDQVAANTKMLLFTALFHSTEILGFLILTYSVSQKKEKRVLSVHSGAMNSELSSLAHDREEKSFVKKVANEVKRIARTISSSAESVVKDEDTMEKTDPRLRNTWALQKRDEENKKGAGATISNPLRNKQPG